jgi:hypothetical protein
MNRDIFLHIMSVVEAHDNYFVQKRNATGVLGLNCFHKVTAALRMLIYGVPAEYVHIGKSTALESLCRFIAAVVRSGILETSQRG